MGPAQLGYSLRMAVDKSGSAAGIFES